MTREEWEIKWDYRPLSRHYSNEKLRELEKYSQENIPRIFNIMLEMVQEIEGWACVSSNSFPKNSVSFKPGVGDKLILRKIYEKHFPPNGLWPILDAINPESVAMRILAEEYYPSFGFWDQGVFEKGERDRNF